VSEERERTGPGWLVTLLGAGLLFLLGFGVGVVVGAARQEPALVLRHLGGEGENVPLAPPGGPEETGESAAPAPQQGPATPAGAAPRAATAGTEAPRPAVSTRIAGNDPTPPSGAAGTPPIAAGAPPVAADAPPLTPRPLVPPAKAPAPPAVAAAPPPGSAAAGAATGRYSIQVGAFAESAQAKTLASKLQRKGFPVTVTPGTGAKDSRWRVRVGPVASREEADRLARKLQSQDKLPTWILDESR
jgi:DedD protein